MVSSDLEQMIADGLAVFGESRDELARWVVTGSPADIDLDSYSIDWNAADEPLERDEWAGVIERVDPIVEWRLGRVASRMVFFYSDPTEATQALYGIWKLRGERWPDAARLDALCDAGDIDEIALLEQLLRPHWRTRIGDLRTQPLFSRLVSNHPEYVAELLRGDVDLVEGIAERLRLATPESLAGLAPVEVDLLTSGSKRRRRAGSRLATATDYDALVPHLQQAVTDGNAAVRAEAIRAWGRVAAPDHLADVVEFCQHHCSGDRSPSVQDALADLAALNDDDPAPVVWPPPDEREPTAEERAAFEEMLDLDYELRLEQHEDTRRHLQRNNLQVELRLPQKLPAKRADVLWSYMTTGEATVPAAVYVPAPAVVDDVAGRLRPVYAFRLEQLSTRYGLMWTWPGTDEMAQRCRATGHPTVLEVQAGGEQSGLGRREVVLGAPRKMLWSRQHVAEWVNAVLPEILSIIDSATFEPADLRKYYEALASVPVLPADARRVLLDQAVGSRKGVRPLAQSALSDDPGIVDDVIDRLSSRKYVEREGAAIWLGELAAIEAVPALHRAAAKESNIVALGAQLATLERLGESVDRYVAPEVLMVKAVKDLTKPMPVAGSWIDVDTLPGLRWADGSDVDRLLIEWFVTQAVRAKSPVPSPIVRHAFARMEPDTVTWFADQVLRHWITEDTSDDTSSAIASKGLLSLAAAGGGPEVVESAARYIRQWYGWRVGQCRALIEMLAWVDDSRAVQFVLSVGNRFRTKGIQDEALHQAELLAERNRWTLDDLAFRTVPTGGFDTDGTLDLDYGNRSFTARLTDDLGVVLSAGDAKTLSALPAARVSDDEDAVKLAKKQLADAKKIVKAAVKDQAPRLRDAMCIQRGFDVDDFQRYVLAHPVMVRLAGRLVWAAVSDGHRTLFRPLSDGTLVDVGDAQVDLDSAEEVTLAHELIDGVDAGATWNSHFADYQVAPLFAQFGRPSLPTLGDGQIELTQWCGTIIDDRRLRSAVNKVGFQLESPGDGGYVDALRRSVVSANLDVQLRVAGLHAAVLEAEVAVGGLYFVTLNEREPVPLGDVPPVLLVETIADVEQIVAAGEGIDPDWESRVNR